MTRRDWLFFLFGALFGVAVAAALVAAAVFYIANGGLR